MRRRAYLVHRPGACAVAFEAPDVARFAVAGAAALGPVTTDPGASSALGATLTPHREFVHLRRPGRVPAALSARCHGGW